jgi:hypothetical protein
MVKYATHATPRADLGEALTQYKIGMKIADLAFPRKTVGAKKSTLSVLTRESLAAKPTKMTRNPDGTYRFIDPEGKDLSYSAQEYGLAVRVDDAAQKEYKNDFDLEMASAVTLENQLVIGREYAAAAALLNTSTWTGTALYTDPSAAPWDAVGSDALGHIFAAKTKVRENCGLEPNTMVCGVAVLRNLMKNTAIRASVQYVKLATFEEMAAAIAPLCGLEQILAGGSVYNASKEGTAFSGSDIWGEDYVLICVMAKPGDPLTVPSVTRSFQWGEECDPNMTWITESYYSEDRRGNVIRMRAAYDDKVVDEYFGHLLKVD